MSSGPEINKSAVGVGLGAFLAADLVVSPLASSILMGGGVLALGFSLLPKIRGVLSSMFGTQASKG